MRTGFSCLPYPAPSSGLQTILNGILVRVINSTTKYAPYIAFFAPPGCHTKGELVRDHSLLAAAERYRVAD